MRVLGQNDEIRERRKQLRHPVYQKPELLAEGPNQVWSWDITKLMGPTKWSYFYLYVILDIFSRRVVGWCVADAESAVLFKPLLDSAMAKHNVPPGQLTLHADRGGPMKAKATALLLADLGVTRSHNRPHTSNDNPFSESHFKTLKYPADLSPTLWLHRGRQKLLPPLLRLVQPGPSPRRDRPDDTGSGALRSDRCRSCRAPAHARPGVPRQSGALRQPAADPTRQADRRLDQSAGTGAEGPDMNATPGSFDVAATVRAASSRRYRQIQPPPALCSMPYGFGFHWVPLRHAIQASPRRRCSLQSARVCTSDLPFRKPASCLAHKRRRHVT